MRILRLVLVTIMLMIINSNANAAVISFRPGLDIRLIGLTDGVIGDVVDVPVTFELSNLSILENTLSTSTRGSGSVNLNVRGWQGSSHEARIGGPIRIFTGLDNGSASASILNISTFDLLFSRSGLYLLDLEFGITGFIAAQGLNDIASASWDLFLESPNEHFGFGGFFGESQDHLCVFTCGLNFDSTPGLSLVNIGKDRRLPITATFRFDVSVSQVTSVTEPSAAAFLLGVFFWLVRRRKTTKAESLSRHTQTWRHTVAPGSSGPSR